MLTLAFIGLLGGLITGISPCILPVLPAVLVAGARGKGPQTDEGRLRSNGRHAYSVIAGLVLSFVVFTLAGSAILDALNLPQNLMRNLGLVVLLTVGLGLIVPRFGAILERPFSHIPQPQVSREAGSFILGAGLGVLYVPCAGPVLAAISVASASRRVGPDTVALTLAFAIGAAVPLLVFALAGREVTTRVRAFRKHSARLRVIGGAIMIALAVLLSTNLTDALQRDVPGYTNALQNDIEGTPSARAALSKISQNSTLANAALQSCGNKPSANLAECGEAPQFRGIQQWLNTPNAAPVSLTQLKGKVVLVDFWTYSCINCQRTLPHLEAWYNAYHNDGLEIVGIHTPEFAFEHVASNVSNQANSLGVKYPVGIDNNYDTWNAYGNEYWPAEYLVDASGHVRHVSFGEGEYNASESLIRQLLLQANPALRLPPATNVPDETPKASLSPETYLGYDHNQYYEGTTQIQPNKDTDYGTPATVDPGAFDLGGHWTVGKEAAAAGAGAVLNLNFVASDIYLVMGGAGTVTVSRNGAQTQTFAVSGTPRLYTLFQSITSQQGDLTLAFTPGVQAYDFTFG